MIELYLDDIMREAILNYDIENSERCYDRDMYYISNTESQILYDIIYGMIYNTDLLEKLGFDLKDIKLLEVEDMNIKFTNKSKYYIKKVN